MSELCVKCGEHGEDRRTLWMACFYAMDELPIPFQQVQVKGTVHELERLESKPMFEGGPVASFPVFKEEADSEERSLILYTLRVCKNCRADWMNAQEAWFKAPASEEMNRLRRENTVLRGVLAKSKVPCIYCGIETMSECKSGFPGCGRMDDLMAAETFEGEPEDT